MLCSFKQMPETSRLWIYQAERTLTSHEASFVDRTVSKFISNWTAHGKSLKASYQLAYHQFLVVAVDEQFWKPSGCGIDAMVHLIKEMERATNVLLMNHHQVAFFIDNKVQLIPFGRLKESIAKQQISPGTLVFDSAVKNLSDFRARWLVASDKTWIKRYFN